MDTQAWNCRKSSSDLVLMGADGNLLADRQVQIRLKNHEFLFGCGVPFVMENIGNIGEENLKPEEKEQIQRWLDVYNYGTMHFYWGFFEREEGKTATQSQMIAAKYLKDHNVKVKGHPLCWHTCCADWLMKYSNEEILAKQKNRIHREVSGFCGLINMWDVINEVVIMPVYDRYDNAVTRICKDLGRVKMVKTMMEEAKAANPESCLLINDFDLSDRYEILIDGCLNAGVPIDAIGLQTHQHQGYMGQEKLEKILRRYEQFGLPIHFTENTLISGELMPKEIVDLNDYQPKDWPTNEEGEARQARELEEMYRILFAHPLVEALTSWDFRDGAWLGAPSGVVRKDGSPKPAYEMLKHLIKEEWSTNTVLHTDANGHCQLTGFRGKYEVTVDGKTAGYTLSKAETSAVLQFQ